MASQFNPETLETVRRLAATSDVFGTARIDGAMLVCEARHSAEPAHYRLEHDGQGWLVSLTMLDRWLSESIETDLMHSGDSLEELLEDELVERDFEGPAPKVDHFRSESKLFTFRSRVPQDLTPDRMFEFILAFEACFARLGDMSAA